MRTSFYEILLYSLLITLGVIALNYAYKYLLFYLGLNKSNEKFVKLHSLPSRKVNGEIQLFYELPEKSQVKLFIIDEFNNICKELKNTEQEEGSYPVSFDTKELKNGSYFYCIKTNNANVSKSMLIEN